MKSVIARVHKYTAAIQGRSSRTVGALALAGIIVDVRDVAALITGGLATVFTSVYLPYSAWVEALVVAVY